MKIIHELINIGKGVYGDGYSQVTAEELLKIYDDRTSQSGGGSSSGNTNTTINGHIILDGAGNIMRQQPNLRFNRMIVTNNNVNQQTIVTRPPSIILSTTPPVDPLVGDEWINSITWKNYVFYDNYWVEQIRTSNVINNDNNIVLSGTTNFLTKYDSPDGLIESNIYDNGTNVGVFTNNPQFEFHILKNGVNLELVTETQSSNRYATNNVLSDVSGASIASFGSNYPESGGSRWAGRSGLYINTGRPNQTLNLWIGTRTILNSLNNGRTAIGQLDPTNWLDVQGDLRIRTINNLNATPSRVLVADTNGVVHSRSLSEFSNDLGITGTTGSTVTLGAGLSFDGDGDIQLGNDGKFKINITELGSENSFSIFYQDSNFDSKVDLLREQYTFLLAYEDETDSSEVEFILAQTNSEIGSIELKRNFNGSIQGLIFEDTSLSNKIVITDNLNEKGLEDASDYSANKTDFSYITPAWMKYQSGYNASVPQYFTHDGNGNFAWVNI